MSALSPVQKQTNKVADATITDQDTINGYSGSISYSMTASDNGTASGTIVYNSYKSYANAPLIDGSVNFSATYNTSTASLSSFRMTFVNVTASTGTESVTLAGTLAISGTESTITTTITMTLTDNVTHKTYGMSNYQLVMTQSASGISMTLSGTYYDPVHGYVVISTVSPVTTSYASGVPDSGVLLFTGSNGTRARLTFTSTGYVVEADSGTGTFVVVP
ncbi:hypothetical protein [Geomonas edaphica]|uniref:hypothetical protein n=1 Tax=Geomonas edaphica TaxID=2570226 RepID=UPI0010A8E27D|nr:hypothetical protein [Geomonas edaphica]